MLFRSGIRFIVESVDKNRIDRIRMILEEDGQEEGGDEAADPSSQAED